MRNAATGTMWLHTLIGFTIVASTLEARAQDMSPASAGAYTEHDFTVTWAPIRLIIPIFELTGEYRVHDDIGVSVTLGGGKRTLLVSNTEIPGAELEGGAQARYYVLGSFSHGMELGVEALYEYVRFEEPLPANVLAVAAGGLTAGPFVGYKVAAGFGLTFEAQLGARYLLLDPPVTGSSSVSPIGDESSRWLPLLHLNVGWSF